MMDALLILNQAMDAAGMKPDADPELLPERIRELRFVGNTCVESATYRGRKSEDGSQSEKELISDHGPLISGTAEAGV
jgi:hypothetical protein